MDWSCFEKILAELVAAQAKESASKATDPHTRAAYLGIEKKAKKLAGHKEEEPAAAKTTATPPVTLGTEVSTSTVTEDGSTVPWLAAKGALAHTPENPPPRIDGVNFGELMPSSIQGSWRPYQIGSAAGFWKAAQERNVEKVWQQNGKSPESIDKVPDLTHVDVAPAAVYRVRGDNSYLYVCQAGNIIMVSVKDQPDLAHGIVTIYRGVDYRNSLDHGKFDKSVEGRRHLQLWLKFRAFVFGDIKYSYAWPFEGTVRAETNHIQPNISAAMTEFAKKYQLSDADNRILFELYRQVQRDNRYSFDLNLVRSRFGPSVFAVQTSLSNIDFTGDFNSEQEVHIINVDGIHPVQIFDEHSAH
jgi:hypothetical protein